MANEIYHRSNWGNAVMVNNGEVFKENNLLIIKMKDG